MLKNKKAIYVLLPLVIAIWGMISYRIYSAVNSSSESREEVFFQAGFTPPKALVDTFSLIANYRDPFLGKTIVETESEKPKSPVIKKEKPKPEAIVWPAIVYKGMIKNQKSNKQLCLVSIAGQDNMMKEGDVATEVELKKITKDSIEVIFKKQSKYFKK